MAKSTSQKALTGPEPEEKIDPATGEIIGPMQQSGGSSIQIAESDMDLLEKYAGAGYSQETEDRLTPVLSILQDNSGEVKRNHERYIDGAESGSLIIRSLRRMYDGKNGFLVQPFGFMHTMIEWTGEEGDGIPVNRFPFHEPPDDLFESPHPKDPNRKVLKRRSSGNRLVDTREHYANIIDGMESPFPVVIPMAGSNHSVSRQWTNMMWNMVYKGKKIPAFFRLYHMKTIFRKKGANQTWYSYQIDPAAFVNDRSLLELGINCYESLQLKPIESNLGDMREIDDAQTVSHAQPVSTVNPAEHI